MGLPCAWDRSTGDGQTIAIIDLYADGVNHPDLIGKVVDTHIFGTQGGGSCHHGWLTAGAAAAIPNNGICTAGTGYNATVESYVIGFCGISSGARRAATLQAIDDGHQIISVSSSGDLLANSEIQYAVDQGVVFTNSASGNALHRAAEIDGYIYVAQANQNFNHVGGGQYQNQTGADVYALCVGVPRIIDQGDCAMGSGNTSFGSPSIAGIVALMRATNSCLSPQEIEQILKASVAQPIGNNPDGRSAGVVDACVAVQHAEKGMDWVVDSDFVLEAGAEKTVSNNVYVKAGATLTVRGTLAVKWKLIVERGAELIVDGGTLTSHCTAQWAGVRVEGDVSGSQATTGKVTLLPNSVIENANSGISQESNHIPWPATPDYYGGLITSDGAVFQNCNRGVAFMKANNDLSSFNNTTFRNIKNDAVTIWANSGKVFEQCEFENVGKSGILSYDCDSEVTACLFANCHTGVDVVNTYPIIGSGTRIIDNTFVDFVNGVFASSITSTTNTTVSDNYFYGGVTSITVSGMSTFDVLRNIIVGPNMGCRFAATAFANSRETVWRNAFSGGRFGVLANFDNNTEFVSNCFLDNDTQLEVNSGAVYKHQGYTSIGASNCLTPSRRIRVSNSLPFYYYRVDELNCRNPFGNGFDEVDALSDFGNDCIPYNGLVIIERDCDPTDGRSVTEKIAELEDELQRLEEDEEIDLILRDYLIRRYKACIQRLRRWQCRLKFEDIEEEDTAIELASEAMQSSDPLLRFFGFSALMQHDLYDEAMSYLASLRDGSEVMEDFVAIQSINIEYVRNTNQFVYEGSNQQVLEGIAAKVTPVSGFARSLIYQLTGERELLPIITEDSDALLYGRNHQQSHTDLDVTVFPNPTRDNVNLQSSTIELEMAAFKIVDITGKPLVSGRLSSSTGFEIDLSSCPAGIMLLQITDVEGTSVVKRIVKQR